MQALSDTIERVRDVFAKCAEPVELAIVFGSIARGSARADSDVDVGVVFSEEVSLKEELELQARIELAVGREVDLVRLDEADILLRYRAARDGVVVHSNPRRAATRFLARAGWEHDEEHELREDAMRRYAARVARGP